MAEKDLKDAQDSVADAATASSGVEVPGRTVNEDAAPGADRPRDRNRIVILGRTQSGKTIFLSALYARLWTEPGDLSIKAIDGRTHKACIEVFQTLREGRWPSSTIGSRYFDFEVSHNGISRALVSLDYPGEVFRKAFVDNIQSPDVEELLDHIDRAAGVIALFDPAVVARSDMRVAMDDDFGMLKAIERIRSWPGGDEVPVAVVLTKYDTRASVIKAAGGPDAFVKQHYRALVEANRDVKVFVASAVQQKKGSSGAEIDRDFKPAGLVAPLRHVVTRLEQIERHKHQIRERAVVADAMQRAVQSSQRARHRAVWLWTSGLVVGVIALAALGWLAWRLGSL